MRTGLVCNRYANLHTDYFIADVRINVRIHRVQCGQ